MRVAYSRLDTFSSRSPNRLFWFEHVQLNLTGKRINWCNTCCSQNSLNTYTHRNLIKYEKKNINPNIQVKYELKLYLRDFIVHMCLFFHESNLLGSLFIYTLYIFAKYQVYVHGNVCFD